MVARFSHSSHRMEDRQVDGDFDDVEGIDPDEFEREREPLQPSESLMSPGCVWILIAIVMMVTARLVLLLFMKA